MCIYRQSCPHDTCRNLHLLAPDADLMLTRSTHPSPTATGQISRAEHPRAARPSPRRRRAAAARPATAPAARRGLVSPHQERAQAGAHRRVGARAGAARLRQAWVPRYAAVCTYCYGGRRCCAAVQLVQARELGLRGCAKAGFPGAPALLACLFVSWVLCV